MAEINTSPPPTPALTADGSAIGVPVRRAEAHAQRLNPPGTVEALVALRTVLLFTITDALGLVVEESMWAGYQLDKALEPLVGKTPMLVTMAVRQEMADGNYARQLQTLGQIDVRDSPSLYDAQVKQADLADWSGVIMSTVKSCYTLRSMDETAMVGQITDLLRDLGVGDPQHPRGARYLPNDVKHRLAQQHTT